MLSLNLKGTSPLTLREVLSTSEGKVSLRPKGRFHYNKGEKSRMKDSEKRLLKGRFSQMEGVICRHCSTSYMKIRRISMSNSR